MHCRRSLVILPFIAFCALALNTVAQSQARPTPSPRPTTIVVANYVKAKDGFEKHEHEVWLPFQQEVVKAGNLASWSVWEVRWAGKNSEYDYLTLDAYKNWAALEKSPYTLELFAKAHPGKEAQAAIRRTGEVRDIVCSDVLALLAQTVPAPQTPLAKYVLVEFWHVAPEKVSEYEKLLLEVYQPWRQEGVKQGKFSFWQFYSVLGAGSESAYNYVTMRGYDKWETLGTVGGPEVLAKAHPKLRHDEIDARTLPLRTLVKTQVLTLVEQVLPTMVQP